METEESREKHIPVLAKEVLSFLSIKNDGVYIDGTFGLGGHSRLILEKLPKGKLIAFEWDKEEVELVNNDLFFKNENFYLINDNFANFSFYLNEMGLTKVDGFLLDLGLSSFQLSHSGKGLSFRSDNLLDMNFNLDSRLTAEYILNNYSPERLADIFYNFGEERKSRQIAWKISQRRVREKIVTTQQLVSIIASCFAHKTNKHPARKVFQALRIYLNKELDNLNIFIKNAFEHLSSAGRIIIISYHSLEDRIVKNLFKEYSLIGKFRVITKKPVIANVEEVKLNNRARSAKMRVIERI